MCSMASAEINGLLHQTPAMSDIHALSLRDAADIALTRCNNLSKYSTQKCLLQCMWTLFEMRLSKPPWYGVICCLLVNQHFFVPMGQAFLKCLFCSYETFCCQVSYTWVDCAKVCNLQTRSLHRQGWANKSLSKARTGHLWTILTRMTEQISTFLVQVMCYQL